MTLMAGFSGERRSGWKVGLVVVPSIVIIGSLMGYVSNSGFENDWYAGLEKPDFQPPSWAFGVTWTILYTMMGAALTIVLVSQPSPARDRGLLLFFAQLLLNYLWSPVFFGAGAIDWALLIILAMDALVVATIIAFRRVKPLAGLLLLPYLAWLCLATALNYETGRLNPGADQAPLGITGA